MWILKWNACKKWTSSLKLVVILSAVSLHWIAQRIFKYSDIQYTSLTSDKILNSLMYRTLFYVNIYGSYKLLKTVRFFGPPCITVTNAVCAKTCFLCVLKMKSFNLKQHRSLIQKLGHICIIFAQIYFSSFMRTSHLNGLLMLTISGNIKVTGKLSTGTAKCHIRLSI